VLGDQRFGGASLPENSSNTTLIALASCPGREAITRVSLAPEQDPCLHRPRPFEIDRRIVAEHQRQLRDVDPFELAIIFSGFERSLAPVNTLRRTARAPKLSSGPKTKSDGVMPNSGRALPHDGRASVVNVILILALVIVDERRSAESFTPESSRRSKPPRKRPIRLWASSRVNSGTGRGMKKSREAARQQLRHGQCDLPQQNASTSAPVATRPITSTEPLQMRHLGPARRAEGPSVKARTLPSQGPAGADGRRRRTTRRDHRVHRNNSRPASRQKPLRESARRRPFPANTPRPLLNTLVMTDRCERWSGLGAVEISEQVDADFVGQRRIDAVSRDRRIARNHQPASETMRPNTHRRELDPDGTRTAGRSAIALDKHARNRSGFRE